MDFAGKDKFHCARKEKYCVFVLEMSSKLTDISVRHDAILVETVNSGVCTSASYSFDA